MSLIQLRLTTRGRPALLSLLQEAGIEATQVRPPLGTIMNAIEKWEILITAASVGSVASILGVWLRALASRTVIIQVEQGRVFNFQAKGYSEEQAAKLLTRAISIAALQTTADESDPNPKPAGRTNSRTKDGGRSKKSDAA